MKNGRRMLICFDLIVLVMLVAPFPPAHAQSPQAIGWFEIGQKEKDPAKKIAAYQKAIAADSGFIEAHFNLGLAYKEQEDYARAEQCFLKASSVRPAGLTGEIKFRVAHELSNVYKRLAKPKEYDEALTSAFNLTNDKKMKAKLSFERGRLLFDQERYEEALAELERGRTINPAEQQYFVNLIQATEGMMELKQLYQAAQQARASGNLDEARALLERIRVKDPEFKNLAAQITELDSMLAAESRRQVLAQLYDQGQKYAEAGDLKMAIAAFESLVEKDSEYQDVRPRLEVLRQQLAQQQLQEQLETEYTTGLAALKVNDWTRAILSFEKILAADPSFREAKQKLEEAQKALDRESAETILARYYADGLAALNQNDLGRALAAFEKVARINADYREVASLLGEIEDTLEQTARAQTAKMESATKLDSLYQAAVAASAREEWLMAIVAFEKLQMLRPNYLDVVDRLAHARARMQAGSAHTGSGSRWYLGGAVAVLLVLPVIGIMIFSPTMRARFHLMRDDYTAAVQIYENVLARYPNRVKLYPRLANLYLLMGRNDERAMKIYKTVLQLNLSTRSREEINAIVAQQYLLEGRTDSEAIGVLEDALKAERSKPEKPGNKF